MWYAVQVRTGTEENICIQCTRKIPEGILKYCFIPHYEEKRKVQGEWQIYEKVLFPGYIFVVTDKIDEMQTQLRKVIGMAKLVGSGKEVVPIAEEEVQFLMQFGGEKQLVSMSEGIIEESKVRIHSGPLMGLEGYIKKIDRHKRKAWLEIPFLGGIQRIQVGLEIISKT